MRVYCLKNELNEIVYIGQTKLPLDERYKQHCKVYPHRKSYTIHLLHESDDKNLIDYLETYYIRLYDTFEYGENNNFGKGQKGMGPLKTSFKNNNTFGKLGTKKVLCIETNIIYNSVKEASEKLNLKANNISAVCNGRQKSTGGYHFKQISD